MTLSAGRSRAQGVAGDPDYIICLQLYCFDPQDPVDTDSETPPLMAFPPAVRATGTGSTHTYRLVQGWSPATPAWFDALTAAGWEAVGYVPRHTAVARVPIPAPDLPPPLVPRWEGVLHPGHRLSPAAGRAWSLGADATYQWPDSRYRLHATFFRGDDPTSTPCSAAC